VQEEFFEMSDQPSIEQASSTALASLTLHNMAIIVSDLESAADWYERVLGFSREARIDIAEGVVILMSGAGVRLELLHPSRMDEPQIRLEPLHADPPGHVLPIGNKFLVFEVDDLAKASAELEELSVTFVWREKQIAPGFIATAVRDFDGNLINILQAPAPH
jgi:catechol 2,3-dioxygenase-like lactoylglutathione lyase family enzyme